LLVARYHCDTCDTVIEGRFENSTFPGLTAEQIEFVKTFIRCEGKINRMEGELNLSYPTIRNRLHETIRAMGYEPGKDESLDISEEKRHSILEDLDAGKISAEAAIAHVARRGVIMTTQTLSLGSKPEIEITNVGGDLAVERLGRADLEARSDNSPRIEQDGDEITISCGGDLNVSMPSGASLTVSYVGGDVRLQNIAGEVSFDGVIGGKTKTENVRKITMGVQVGHVGRMFQQRLNVRWMSDASS